MTKNSAGARNVSWAALERKTPPKNNIIELLGRDLLPVSERAFSTQFASGLEFITLQSAREA